MDAQPEAPGRLSGQSPQKGFLCLLSQPNPSSPKEGMVPEGWQAKMLEGRARWQGGGMIPQTLPLPDNLPLVTNSSKPGLLHSQ